MNDYSDMRAFLDSQTDVELCHFCQHIGWSIVVDTKGNTWKEFDNLQESQMLSSDDWRSEITEGILAFREKNKALWNMLCHHAHIETDSIRQMKYAHAANRKSAIALIFSILAFAWSIISSLLR